MKFTTAKQTEQSAYEQVRLNPFTKIHGRPSRLDRNTLREELCAAASEVDMPYEESGDFGLLGEVMEADEYTTITALTYYPLEKPSAYDEDITEEMDHHERKQLEAEHNERLEAWHTRKGALRGLTENIRDALDEKFYIALKRQVIAYKTVTVRDYIQHLDVKWCKLDTRVIKNMKDHYYRGWETAHDEHIEEFIKRLNEEQVMLLRDRIKISTEDKRQHFLEEMYEATIFDRRDYKDWEDKNDEEKTWDAATEHFSGIVDNMDTYNHNVQGTAKRSKFESAAQVEDAAAVEEQRDDTALQHFLEQAAMADEKINAVTTNQTSMVSMQSSMQKMMMDMKLQMEEQYKQMSALKIELARAQKVQKQPEVEVKPEIPAGKHLCKRCNFVHGPTCYKDPKNAKKVPAWYKEKYLNNNQA